MKSRISLFILLVITLAGCSKRPKNIIKEDKMVEIMADLQIAEAYERNGKADPEMHGVNRELLGRGILMNHGVSVEDMDSTLAWYGRNMDEYSQLYKKVDQRLAKMQLKYARAAGESDNEGPSTDLWPYGRHFVIDNNQLTDGIVVNIPVPELTAGDRLTWKMRTHGASERRMTLGVNYENGRTEIVNIKNNGAEPWIETSLQTDSIETVARIFAILNVDNVSKRVFVDSIQLLHYPFNREEYNRTGFQRKIGVAQRKVDEEPSDTLPTGNREIKESPDISDQSMISQTKKTTLKPIKALKD